MSSDERHFRRRRVSLAQVERDGGKNLNSTSVTSGRSGNLFTLILRHGVTLSLSLSLFLPFSPSVFPSDRDDYAHGLHGPRTRARTYACTRVTSRVNDATATG